MIDFLRDPVWQFVGALLALIALLVSIYLFVLQRKKKSLVYDILILTPILGVKDKIVEGNVRIFFGRMPVKNVHLLVLKISNNGTVPIKTTDFEEPLTFHFGKDAKVLSVDIAVTIPPTLKPMLNVKPNYIVVEPTLLNAGDTAVLKILLAEYSGTIHPETRIVGVHDMRLGQYEFRPLYMFAVASSVAEILLLIVILFFSNYGGISSSVTSILLFAWFTICLLIGAIAFIPPLRYEQMNAQIVRSLSKLKTG